MKKSSFILGALCALTGAAFAQSSVTIFGVVDLNARYIKNGDVKTKQLGFDGLSASRLGFRGIEDLGGGLKAGLWIESALNPDTGTTPARFWHRRSTVSLLGGFGELRLGRDLVPTHTAWGGIDSYGGLGLGDPGILPLLRGGSAAWPQEVYAEISESQVGRAIRTKRWKYSVRADHTDGNQAPAAAAYREEFLYDLLADPHELTNLAGVDTFAAVSEQLCERLRERVQQAGEPVPEIVPAPVRPGGQRAPTVGEGGRGPRTL